MPFEWTITVVGAVLCVLYGWCLNSVARNQTIWIVKIGPLISVVGTVILAGMAMSGHGDVAEHIGTVPEYSIVVAPERVVVEEVPENRIRWDSILSTSRASHEIEFRPSKSHIAHKDVDGELSWVTWEGYRVLASEKRKRDD